jgi:DNA-binding GntR family transcriptional regulator
MLPSMTVDPDSPEPLYEQLARLLRERIKSGEITSRLPSVKTITQEQGVSHITVEHALDLLKAEGLVMTVMGKGTYVVRP